MIESGCAIRLAAAATEQQQVSSPPTLSGFEQQPACVMRAHGSLEPVQDDEVRSSGWGVETNEIDEVTIVRLPTFDTCFERRGTPEEAPPHRSGVWAGEPPCRRIGVHYH